MGCNEQRMLIGRKDKSFHVFDFSNRAGRMDEFNEANDWLKKHHVRKQKRMHAAGASGFDLSAYSKKKRTK